MTGCGRDPYRDVATEKLQSRAANELNTFNFSMAAEMYQSLLDRTPEKDPKREPVLFGLAISLQNVTPATEANINAAGKYYQMLVDEAPKSHYTPTAILQLGRIAEVPDYMGDPIDLDGARAQYQKVIEGWPNDVIADEAALRIAGSYIQVYDNRESIEQGVKYLRDWLARKPNNEMASVMWEYLAKTYDKYLDQPGEALNAYIEADKIGLVNQAVAGRTWWHMTELAEKLNRLDVAVKYHQKVVVEAPKSGRAWESQQALKRIAKAHPEMKITIPEIRLFNTGQDAQPKGEPEVSQ